ncbi:hypothetical protein EDB81DRAFT_129757 [Dactylonectria macrodidyma]|uniref:Fungal N-terminal domain-containing protein n=1 Tax=Dactylonectria macrodidyma TaxID=307937 RepID=A0A9P9E5K5_9HYPO|nr:hypothetical protein EDB81DRAFT_129757 [Dactylonectria macrodidyma]
MDPLSLTASLIAIGTAATTALQISISFCDLAKTYKSAAGEIEDFALDLRAFASVVQLGQDSLERHRNKSPLSEVIRYIESFDVLNQLASQSKRTTTNIERVWQQTRSLQSDNLLTKVKWIAKKSEVRGLKPDMESLKSSLHLVMAAITMEALQKNGSEDAQEEIKSLRRQLQVQLETIHVLQQSQERLRIELSNTVGSYAGISFPTDAQRALVELGESMVENGTVPNVGHRARPSSGPSGDILSSTSRSDPFESINVDTVDPPSNWAQTLYPSSITPSQYASGLIIVSRGKTSQQRVGFAFDSPYNIISERLVDSVGISSTYHQVPNIWIDLGDGRLTKCLGEAFITWKQAKRKMMGVCVGKYSIEYRMHCLVFRNVHPDLIFGQDSRDVFENSIKWDEF